MKQFNFYFFGFLIGMSLSYYTKAIRTYLQEKTILKILLALVALLLYTSKSWIPNQFLYPLKLVLIDPTTVGASLIILIVITSSKIQKILSIKYLSFIGEISYGIYLVHYFIILAILPHLYHFLNTIGLNYIGINNSIGILFTLIVSILISKITYNYIELPFVKIGKLVSKSITKRIMIK